MQAIDIQSEIREWKKCAETSRQQAWELERIIEEQKEAKRKYENICYSLERFQQKRKEDVKNLELYTKHIKFLYGYQAKNYEIFEGTKALKVKEHIETTTMMINDEIMANQQRLEELENQYIQSNYQIDLLEKRMREI